MAPTANAELLQCALQIRAIIATVDDFFVEPNEQSEARALGKVGDLPGAMRRYRKLSLQSNGTPSSSG